MAARRPDQGKWPLGLRSPALGPRDTGLWRPVAAVAVGLIGPSLVALAIIALIGGVSTPTTPSAMVGPGWLAQVDYVLFALMGAPLLAFVGLPLGWFVMLVLLRLGYAGACSAVLSALFCGLPVVHVFLNGDLTTESTEVLPAILVALAVLGISIWAALWGLVARCVAGSEQQVENAMSQENA